MQGLQQKTRRAFSVGAVIPTYNNPAYLRRAIDSVLAQTRPPDEIVIVNDGSTDSTLDAVATYGSSVRCVTQSNQGAAAARNRGVAEVGTDWVAFLDQDDTWLPDKLAVQCDAIERTPGAAFSIASAYVYCGEQCIGESIRSRRVVERDARIRNCFGSASGYMIRRDAFLALGGFCVDQETYAEDWELAFRLYRRHPLCVVGDKLFCYYVTPGSASSDGERMVEAELRMMKTTLLEGLHGIAYHRTRLKLLASIYYRLALTLPATHARIKPLLHSLFCWPFVLGMPPRVRLLLQTLVRG